MRNRKSGEFWDGPAYGARRIDDIRVVFLARMDCTFVDWLSRYVFLSVSVHVGSFAMGGRAGPLGSREENAVALLKTKKIGWPGFAGGY